VVLNFGLYSGALAEAIHLLKFSGLRRLARPLGKFFAELPIPVMDAIVPVPATGRTLRDRGFNQTLLLSRSLSRHLRIPVHMNLLIKKKETLPQIGLGARERAGNLKNSFEVRGRLNSQRLVLLDDVMTTGATVRECAKTLRKAGAREVVVVTLARSSLTQ
jgi:ComF family protein